MSNYKQLKQQGEQLYHQGEYQQAIEKLTQLLSLLSQQFKNKQVKDEKQGRHLIKTIKLPCLKTLSQCQFKLRRLEDCQLTCSRILKIDNDCGSTLYMKALIKIQHNEIEQAMTLFARVCLVEPDNSVYQKKYQQIKDGSLVKQNFFDRQVNKISGVFGWVLSLIATLIAMTAFGYKIVTLVVIFIRNNLERLIKLVKKYLGMWIEWNLNLITGMWKRVGDIGRWCVRSIFGRKEKIL